MVGLAYSFTVEGSPAIHSFNMLDMTPTIDGHLPHIIKGSIFDKGQEIWGWDARKIGFLITFFAFAIKLPIVPLHTWLPDAHVEAPTAVSVILAGVLLKVGGYGIIRISYGIFPEAAIGYSGLVGILGVIAMIYGAWVAMGQKDLKAMIAYSSISHLGYCLLGLSSLTLSGYYGAVLQMFNHGLTSAILFLLVGVLYDRVHIREISLFQGLWQKMPFFTFFVIIGFFASLGLPGFNTFVSEMLVFMGAFQAGVKGELPLWMSFLAVTTIVFGAVYFLRAFRTMFMGKYPYAVHQNWDMKLIDLDTREYYLLIPLAMLLLFFGIFPHIILNMIEKSYLLWIWK
jgi:NADH-quinone oxidoreductase subunit M